jgi:hypothetical protein
VRERRTHARGAAHGVGHLLVAPERLDAQPDGLELRAHLHELLHVPARAHEVLGHHLARVLRRVGRRSLCARRAHHLTSLGALADVGDELLLRRLELGALAVELALRLSERALVLPQPLCRRHRTPEERLLWARRVSAIAGGE